MGRTCARLTLMTRCAFSTAAAATLLMLAAVPNRALADATADATLPEPMIAAARVLSQRLAELGLVPAGTRIALLAPLPSSTVGQMGPAIASLVAEDWKARASVIVLPPEAPDSVMKVLFTGRRKLEADVELRKQFFGESKTGALVSLAILSEQGGVELAADLWTPAVTSAIHVTSPVESAPAPPAPVDSAAVAPPSAPAATVPPPPPALPAKLHAVLPRGVSLQMDGVSLSSQALSEGVAIQAGAHSVTASGMGASRAQDTFVSAPGSLTNLSIGVGGTGGRALGSFCLSAILPGLGLASCPAPRYGGAPGAFWTKTGATLFYACILAFAVDESDQSPALTADSDARRATIRRTTLETAGAGYLVNLLGSWSYGARHAVAGRVTHLSHAQSQTGSTPAPAREVYP